MQQPSLGYQCTADRCMGRMVQEYSEDAMHTQLKYLESLFDVSRLKKKFKGDAESKRYVCVHAYAY